MLVWCWPDGTPILPEAATNATRRVRDAAGVPAEVQPLHGTRNYHLTAGYRHDVDLVTLQARAGHTNISQTAKYITPDAERDQDAADRIAGELDAL